MCEGLIAGAGKSQRTGPYYKMELDFDGKTLLEKCLESMLPFCSRVLIASKHTIRLDVDCPGILLDIDTLEDYQKALDMTRCCIAKEGSNEGHQ